MPRTLEKDWRESNCFLRKVISIIQEK